MVLLSGAALGAGDAAPGVFYLMGVSYHGLDRDVKDFTLKLYIITVIHYIYTLTEK